MVIWNAYNRYVGRRYGISRIWMRTKGHVGGVIWAQSTCAVMTNLSGVLALILATRLRYMRRVYLKLAANVMLLLRSFPRSTSTWIGAVSVNRMLLHIVDYVPETKYPKSWWILLSRTFFNNAACVLYCQVRLCINSINNLSILCSCLRMRIFLGIVLLLSFLLRYPACSFTTHWTLWSQVYEALSQFTSIEL